MNWSEITVFTTKEGIDEVSRIVLDCGAEGIVIEDESDFLDFLENNRSRWDYVDEELMNQKHCETNIKTYVPCDETGFEIFKKIEAAADELRKTDASSKFGRLRVETSLRDDSEWKDKWKEYFKPFCVGQKLYICPAWIEADVPADRSEVKLETGQLFGTGLHATTRLCLDSLEKYINESSRVLDLGTGSGILAVAAAKLGAPSVRAIDIDDGVYKTLENNLKLNNIAAETFEIVAGDVLSNKKIMVGRNEKYDVIVANIVADVIIALSKITGEFLADDGIFMVSGIIDERAKEVENALISNGFAVVEHRALDGWNEFICKIKN